VLLKHGKADDNSRLWKTTEHHRRVRKYRKEKLDNIFSVVATTRLMSNSSTINKSQSRYLAETQVVYSQENSTGNHNSILPTIYISIYGPCYGCALSYPNLHALFSCPLLIHHAFSSRPTCCIHVP